ncbi:hypothetical protein [Salinicoccus sp. HZC-1]|uniref:hypothetical protein n=1 Tax=Salinicoccus sp. HZC-1 TaxID=3385497 RepID=UPI00398AB672
MKFLFTSLVNFEWMLNIYVMIADIIIFTIAVPLVNVFVSERIFKKYRKEFDD